jgi:Dolichyl-phosphate-mannose-protein mannosyltransferase
LARKPKRTAIVERPASPPPERPANVVENASAPNAPQSRLGTISVVIGLLMLHYALAARSLLRENPTVDEVAHMPAGITYWQKGTFKLYHHNPPLFKLVAALPVVMAGPETAHLYDLKSWRSKSPSQATFSQSFAFFNADRYFELFQLARLMMPLFTVVGGLVVFAWSARLYGKLAGLLSLALWVFCPNILAHARLVTSDACSTAMGVAATYVFWRYLYQPTWRWAVAAGVLLGVAQLSKFSMLLLYAVWPFLWLAHLVMVGRHAGAGERRSESTLRPIARGIVHGVAIVALSILTIDVGYFFEGVGIPLGDFEFGSRTLTRPVPPGTERPHSENPLLAIAWQFRVNRFRGTLLDRLPVPLPEHYLLGFDEQKIEAEGIPVRYSNAIRDGRIDEERRAPQPGHEETSGYTVYLDGELRETGWRTYYLRALLYKIPEGTWLLIALSLVALVAVRRPATGWFDELALWTLPVVILLSMSLLTDINLGLRYVLGVLPYIFVSTGKVVPWCLGLRASGRRVAGSIIVGSLALTIAASAWIQPSYLAYFNWASGGPDRDPVRLIDSNLDWGQDLVELQRWWKANIPDQPIGLAYFGQFNPSIFELRGEPFRWFLPPGRPGTVSRMPGATSPRLIGPARKLTPGYYAVSATLLYGLPWRLYDPAPLSPVYEAIAPTWKFEKNALTYFQRFRPIMAPIGHSIYVYRLTEEDVARVNAEFEEKAAEDRNTQSHRLPTDIHLRDVVLTRRPEEDVDLEARLPQPIRQVGAELSENRIPPVAAGMADPRGAVFDTSIGKNDRPGKGSLRTGQEGHRENVSPARHQHAANLTEGGVQIGDMLERLGREHQVERRVGIGQSGEVLGADSVCDRARSGAGLIVGGREVRQAPEDVMHAVDSVDLGDAHRLDFRGFDPPGQRRRRGRGGADGVEPEHGLRDATTPELGPARCAIARLLPREGLGQPWREPPELLEPARDHATAIEHRPGPAADRAALEAAMRQGIEVVARDPSILMGRVPGGDEESLEPNWDRTRHGLAGTSLQIPGSLRDGILGDEATHLGRLEGQHDPVLRYPRLLEFRGDAMLQPVALDPQLAVDDVDMDQAAVNPFLVVPADVHQDIPIAGPVEDGLCLDIAVSVGDLGVLGQDRFDDRADLI